MFFELICLFSVLMDIICIPSSNYFFNSNRPSTRMPFSPTGHVSTRVLQNSLPLQHLLDNKVLLKSVHSSSVSHSTSDSNVPSIRISSFALANPIFTKIFQNEQLLQQLKNKEAIAENALQHRERRGIVLIDEDFDVPPEPGVKQGWSNGDFDKNRTNSDKKSIEVMSTEEGSGQIEEFFSAGTIPITTPGQLQVSTDKIQVTPTKEYDKTISTSEHADKMISTSKHANKETSPMEYTDKIISTSEYADKETSAMEYTDKMSSTIDDIEGSGEISVQFTPSLPTTEKPEVLDEKSTIKVCLKRTCNSEDLLLSPGNTRKVPEGTNLTLSCSSVNESEHGLLKLYKYNNSDNSLLEESNKEEKLNFLIPVSQKHHSGTYMCLKFTEKSCCHQQLDITVYEVPNYKTHLIVVGLIAAISLFTCILIGIYRSFKRKNYEVQMELQNMEKPVLF